MSVWLNDLRENWLSWLAVALTCFIAGAGCSLALALIMGTSGDTDDSAALGGTVLGMALGAVVLVTWSQMRLIVDEHRDIYRSWRMVGMPSWLIVVLVLGQVAVSSVAGSVPGAWLIRFALPWSAAALRSDGIPLGSVSVTPAVIAWATAVCTLSALLGALFSVRRVFRPVSSPRWLGVKAALGVLAIGATVYGCYRIPDAGDVLAGCMGLVVLAGCLVPWVLPLLDPWTRVLGIAGANVRVRRHFSSPHIMPWVLSGGLIIGVGSGLRALMSVDGDYSISPWQVFVVVLGPTIAPSVAAALSTSLLMRRRITRDAHGLCLAGAPRTALFRVQLGEAFALSATATTAVAALAAGIALLQNHALWGQWRLTGFWWPPLALMAGVMFVGLAGIKIAIAAAASHQGGALQH